jgi:spore maturation protein CgeB
VQFNPRPSRPCAFLGSLYNERRHKIARIVKRHGGEVLDSPGSWIYQDRLAEYVQTTKVIVGDNARNDVPGYWSSRNYIIPGAGGFLLTSNVPGLSSDFEFGKHVAVYDGAEALDEAIETCLAMDSEREAIRKAGFEHVRKNHGWVARARVLLNTLKIHARV